MKKRGILFPGMLVEPVNSFTVPSGWRQRMVPVERAIHRRPEASVKAGLLNPGGGQTPASTSQPACEARRRRPLICSHRLPSGPLPRIFPVQPTSFKDGRGFHFLSGSSQSSSPLESSHMVPSEPVVASQSGPERIPSLAGSTASNLSPRSRQQVLREKKYRVPAGSRAVRGATIPWGPVVTSKGPGLVSRRAPLFRLHRQTPSFFRIVAASGPSGKIRQTASDSLPRGRQLVNFPRLHCRASPRSVPTHMVFPGPDSRMTLPRLATPRFPGSKTEKRKPSKRASP